MRWVNTAMSKCLNTLLDACLGVRCFEAVRGTKLPMITVPMQMMLDNKMRAEEV